MIDNMLVWNVQGLGTTKKKLSQMVRTFNVAIVAILEPFSDVNNMDQVAWYLGFLKSCSNAEMGGKIWVVWDDSYECEANDH